MRSSSSGPSCQPFGRGGLLLRALHPSPPTHKRANLGRLRRVSPSAAPVADIDQVRKAVYSFPSTSGAGRTGLRPSHLRDAMRPASSDLILRLIAEVVNLLLQGEVPEAVRPFVCGASIMALRKPNGTLRPIAVGETIRRITSKVAVELLSERARTILEPLQLGVKTPNGCEAIIHTTRQWFHKHRSDPTKTAVSVDISNAFNTVHRSAVLQSVRTLFPSLAPWVDCCYRHDSHLFTGSSDVCDQVISSSRGVQQGDPLGPFLFALAVHSASQEARRDTEQAFSSGLDICAFYLDDGLCAASAQAVGFFLSSLVAGLSRIGLVVNLSKTEVIPACPTSQSFGPGDFTGCTWNGSASFKLLGAAIETTDWCEALLRRRVDKARDLIDAIGRFPDAQGAFCLLMWCSGWAKVLYSCRTVPPSAQSAGLLAADSDIRLALGRLVGSSLSDADWRLCLSRHHLGRGRCPVCP